MPPERLKPFLQQEDYMKDRVNSGIEANRKGWFTLHVTDELKHAVSGAKVTVRQKSHEFKIGANCRVLYRRCRNVPVQSLLRRL